MLLADPGDEIPDATLEHEAARLHPARNDAAVAPVADLQRVSSHTALAIIGRKRASSAVRTVNTVLIARV